VKTCELRYKYRVLEVLRLVLGDDKEGRLWTRIAMRQIEGTMIECDW
jgi:hypothetical protein